MLPGSKEAFMFAYPRRLAFGVATLAALLLSLGLVALTATPALATACPSISYMGGPTLTDCSTSFTITQSGGTFSVQTNYNISNGVPLSFSNDSGYDTSNNVLVGVYNNTGSTVYDLKLTSFTPLNPSTAIFVVPAGETLCNTSPSVCFPGGNGMEGKTSSGQEVIFNITSIYSGDVVFGSGLLPGQTAYFGLNYNGSVVCVTDQTGACVTTTVSEPAAIGIFLAGLLGFAVLRRRWLAKAAAPRQLRLPRRIRHLGWISRLLVTA
jgi:hypothetical protein